MPLISFRKKLCQIHTESLCNSINNFQRRVTKPSLNIANIPPVKLSPFPKLFLTQIESPAAFSYNFPKFLFDIHSDNVDDRRYFVYCMIVDVLSSIVDILLAENEIPQ